MASQWDLPYYQNKESKDLYCQTLFLFVVISNVFFNKYILIKVVKLEILQFYY